MRMDENTDIILNPFSKYITILFAILFVMNIKDINSIVKCSLIRSYILIMLLIIIFAIMTIVVVGNRFVWVEVRSLTMCLVAIIIGYTTNLSDKQFLIILTSFAVSSLIVGISIVIKNIGSFTITENSSIIFKNAIGIILSTGSIISFYLSFNRNNKMYKILLLAISITILVTILTIRARAAGLLTILSYIIIMYLKNKDKRAILTITLLIVILFFVMPQGIKNYVIDSFFKGFEDKDITSDRGRRNMEALLFLKDNILIGNMNRLTSIDQVHNYPLRILFNGGIVFAFPILLLYFYLIIKDIYYLFKVNLLELRNIGFVIIVIPFGISMLEPTLPFGPGTTTVFSFMLLGISLKNIRTTKI